MATLRIATWNVNSIRQRLHILPAWLKEDAPDIVLLQETKVMNDAFPAMEIEELGYNLALHGQKTFNGVAILSKYKLEDVVIALPGDEADDHARYIEAVVNLPGGAMRVISVYVPNGQEVGSDKFNYKLRFLDRLHAHLKQLLTYDEMLVIGGDYNIAPCDIDVYDPISWKDQVLCHPEERKRLRAIEFLGLYDAYRALHKDRQEFSWWDYRAGAWENGKGLRIDHLLLSAQAMDKLESCEIVSKLRGLEKPSDHTPVMVKLQ